MLAIVVIVSVTVVNNMQKEKQFAELNKISEKADANVVRNGVVTIIDSKELVVGDIVILKTGQSIPADCIIFEANDLNCNESDFTGEPDAKEKTVIDV